jgi:hypothetical protein
VKREESDDDVDDGLVEGGGENDGEDGAVEGKGADDGEDGGVEHEGEGESEGDDADDAGDDADDVGDDDEENAGDEGQVEPAAELVAAASESSSSEEDEEKVKQGKLKKGKKGKEVKITQTVKDGKKRQLDGAAAAAPKSKNVKAALASSAPRATTAEVVAKVQDGKKKRMKVEESEDEVGGGVGLPGPSRNKEAAERREESRTSLRTGPQAASTCRYFIPICMPSLTPRCLPDLYATVLQRVALFFQGSPRTQELVQEEMRLEAIRNKVHKLAASVLRKKKSWPRRWRPKQASHVTVTLTLTVTLYHRRSLTSRRFLQRAKRR